VPTGPKAENRPAPFPPGLASSSIVIVAGAIDCADPALTPVSLPVTTECASRIVGESSVSIPIWLLLVTVLLVIETLVDAIAALYSRFTVHDKRQS
jgi:hypothetical protein